MVDQAEGSGELEAAREEEEAVIYGLRAPGGEIRYIGRSRHHLARFGDHLSAARSSASPVGRWIQSVFAAGQMPEIVVLERVSARLAHRCEQDWISRGLKAGSDLLNKPRGSEPSVDLVGKPAKPSDDLLTAAEVAVLRKAHLHSVYRAIGEGRLKAERRGRIFLIRRGDALAWKAKPGRFTEAAGSG